MSNENMKIISVFQLPVDEYPSRSRTNIVITDAGDMVKVGVKATARVYERNEDGSVSVSEEQWGDIRALSKDAPIGCIFDSIKELFDTIPEIIDRTTSNGDKA